MQVNKIVGQKLLQTQIILQAQIIFLFFAAFSTFPSQPSAAFRVDSNQITKSYTQPCQTVFQITVTLDGQRFSPIYRLMGMPTSELPLDWVSLSLELHGVFGSPEVPLSELQLRHRVFVVKT